MVTSDQDVEVGSDNACLGEDENVGGDQGNESSGQEGVDAAYIDHDEGDGSDDEADADVGWRNYLYADDRVGEAIVLHLCRGTIQEVRNISHRLSDVFVEVLDVAALTKSGFGV